MDNNRYIDFEAYIEPDKSFLTLFFRNLILGEQNELKNRYMLIGYVGDTPTSTPQVPNRFKWEAISSSQRKRISNA